MRTWWCAGCQAILVVRLSRVSWWQRLAWAAAGVGRTACGGWYVAWCELRGVRAGLGVEVGGGVVGLGVWGDWLVDWGLGHPSDAWSDGQRAG